MDDLDAFFTDEAAEAFASGIIIDFGGDQKIELASKLMEDDQLILSSLSNAKKPEEEKKFGKIVLKRKEVNPH